MGSLRLSFDGTQLDKCLSIAICLIRVASCVIRHQETVPATLRHSVTGRGEMSFNSVIQLLIEVKRQLDNRRRIEQG